jgi:hypothetical protein
MQKPPKAPFLDDRLETIVFSAITVRTQLLRASRLSALPEKRLSIRKSAYCGGQR